tara:strand:+ start:304 stop:549 length:246 start_codon:yes stop_codon:yes gene_type:complete
MNTLQQLMVITMEECGELIQQCSKCLRKGECYNDKELIEEIGDVHTMIELMLEYNIASRDEIEKRAKVKRERLKKWSDLIN